MNKEGWTQAFACVTIPLCLDISRIGWGFQQPQTKAADFAAVCGLLEVPRT